MSEDEPFGPSAAQPAGAVARPRRPRGAKAADRGRLKIGDDWNAIRIIALSQSNPLKAIAEFVENSIDAHAKTVPDPRHPCHHRSQREEIDQQHLKCHHPARALATPLSKRTRCAP